ncbi:hypothetical protein CYR55_02490 [Chimaeribacter californicus]|uniref:Uncharacterized protein n=1 Tax=Chimaeribacter californicus TaxID=2060067 RepID=A0A2N5EGN8_9GAMM|nr:hypothetical protein [Chimaeribacter californicus]PLR41713.1 hypothetical protein CYR55_02490 [Chimaeribacter californicus]
MFYFRANQVKLTSNGSTRSLFNWRKDLSDVKLISFVTTSQSILPDIDTWLDSNDPAQKTALLARAVQSVSSSQILTTVENVKDNARLTFGTTGYNLYQNDKIPEDINWCLMAIKSNKDTRELGSVFSSIADHAEFNTFASSLGALVVTAANPAFRAGVEITKFVTEVMSQRLQDEDDEQLGLLYLSLNRTQHYPYGERKENAVTDLTGNMLVDYSIFGVEEGANPQSTLNAAPQNGSEPAPKELAKQTIEASLAAAAAAARQTLAEKASAAASVPEQPAEVLAMRAKAFLKERESGVLDQARQIMAGIAGAAVSAAGDAAGQAMSNLTTQLGAAALKAINGNAPPVGTPVQGIAQVTAIPDQPADVLAGSTGTGNAATLPTGGSGTEPQDGTTSGDPGATGAPGAPIAAPTQKTVVEAAAAAAPVGDVQPAGTEPAPGAKPSGQEMVGDTPPDALPPAGQAPSASPQAGESAAAAPEAPAPVGQPPAEAAGEPAPVSAAEPAAVPEGATQLAAAEPAAESSAIPDQPADVLAAGVGTDSAATQPTGGSGTNPQDGTSSGDPRANMPLGGVTEKEMIEIKAAAAPVGDVQTAGQEVSVPGAKEIITETPAEAVPPAGQAQPAAAPVSDSAEPAAASAAAPESAPAEPAAAPAAAPESSPAEPAAEPAAAPESAPAEPAAAPAAAPESAPAEPAAAPAAAPESAPAEPAAAAGGSSAIPDQPADALAAGTGTDNAATQPTGGTGTNPQDGTSSGDAGAGANSGPTADSAQAAIEGAAIPDQPAEALAAGQVVAPGVGVIVQAEGEATPDAGQAATSGGSSQPAAVPEKSTLATPEGKAATASTLAAANPDPTDDAYKEIVVEGASTAAAATPAAGQPADAGQAVDPGSDPAAAEAQKPQK